MKRAAQLVCLLLFTLLAVGVTADDHSKTMVGEYNWNQGISGDLKAIFTPDGDGQWKVDFHFDFRSEPHTYSGIATGSLDGKLEGTVKNEDKNRTFVFQGTFNEGVFEGDHSETTPGRARQTGTLMLQ